MNKVDILRQKILAEAGLSHSERNIYLLTLQTRGLTSAEIITKTKLPRPTVLAGLKELRGRGLCEAHRRDGRSYIYVMQPPQVLKAQLGKRVRYLDGLMDQLDQIDMGAHEALSVQNNEGRAGVEEFLELALRCSSRKWQIIAPRDNAIAHMPKDYIAYFKKVRSERQIQSQTLWEAARKDEEIPIRDVLMRKPRYIPENIGQNIPSLMLGFDDMLLVIDGTEHPSAALIRNKPVASTFQLLFETAWRSSRQY